MDLHLSESRRSQGCVLEQAHRVCKVPAYPIISCNHHLLHHAHVCMVTMQPVLLYSQAPAMLFEKKKQKKTCQNVKIFVVTLFTGPDILSQVGGHKFGENVIGQKIYFN